MIASATWNSIFTDIATALTQTGQSNLLPYSGFIVYTSKGVNFNSANTDTGVALTNFPAWASRFTVNSVLITNASGTLTTASAGVFTSTSAGGNTLAVNQTLTVTNSTDATANNMQALTLTNVSTASYLLSALPHSPTLYVRVGTAQGVAATADVTLTLHPIP